MQKALERDTFYNRISYNELQRRKNLIKFLNKQKKINLSNKQYIGGGNFQESGKKRNRSKQSDKSNALS